MHLGQLTVFFKYMRINFSVQFYSFHFFGIFFLAYAVTVSKFSELFIYAATVFFLPELILHKYSVEGYFQEQKQLDPIIPEQANHPISVLCPKR